MADPYHVLILQEDCSLGQRVRAYRLEGKAGGSWMALGRGTAIGHKRIQPVQPIVVGAMRLVAEKSVGQPAIRRFALFDTGAEQVARTCVSQVRGFCFVL